MTHFFITPLNHLESPPVLWVAHAKTIWGAPLNLGAPVAWKGSKDDAQPSLTPNMVTWGRLIVASELATATHVIENLHRTLSALRDTPCVRGYPGLDETLAEAATFLKEKR